MRFAIASLVLPVALMSKPHSALAQSSDEVTAEALFRAGREASVEGRHAQACMRFKESFRLEPVPGTLLNIAICEEELGRLASAWQGYQGVLDALPASDERAELARSHLSKLEPRLPRLTLRLAPNAPPNTSIRRDRNVVGSASIGLALPLDPGRHDFAVVAPRHAERRFVVVLREGEHRELVLEPGAPVDQVERRVPAGPPGHERKNHLLAHSLLAAGALGFVGGAIATGFALDRLATVHEHCHDKLCDPSGLEASREGKKLTALAGYGFAIALAGLGSGAYLLLTSTGAEATPAPRASLGLSASRIEIRGRF